MKICNDFFPDVLCGEIRTRRRSMRAVFSIQVKIRPAFHIAPPVFANWSPQRMDCGRNLMIMARTFRFITCHLRGSVVTCFDYFQLSVYHRNWRKAIRIPALWSGTFRLLNTWRECCQVLRIRRSSALLICKKKQSNGIH